jgi:hypothetical protein
MVSAKQEEMSGRSVLTGSKSKGFSAGSIPERRWWRVAPAEKISTEG